MDWLKTLFRGRRDVANTLPPEGPAGVEAMGHREYVGGMWDEIGALQLYFLKSRGLRPHHVLLDIACGSLRLGSKAMPYLDPGCYQGIEKEAGLIEAGLEAEIAPAIVQAKTPELVVSSEFEFSRFSRSADYAIAQSLFTHVTPTVIDKCLRNLKAHLSHDGVLYATFFQADRQASNPSTPHDHAYFAYTRDEMESFGGRLGYDVNYIGNWNHPRGQVMVEYRPG